MRTLLLLAALAACRTQTEDRFSGVPEGSRHTCSQDRTNPTRGQCIAGGKRLRCFFEEAGDEENWWREISCAPYKVFR